MPVKALSQIQLATESPWGTAVTPTVVLMGVEKDFAVLSDNKSEVFDDVRNSLAGSPLAGLEQIAGKGKYNLLCTYEDAPYVFDNAFGQASPSGTGPYTRAYTGATSAQPTIRPWTLIDGNSQTGGPVRTATGVLVNTVKMSGATGKATMVSGDLLSKVVDTSKSLQALSARTVQVVMGLWSLYIDNWGGTIGTTAVAASMVAWDLNINLNRMLTYSQDSLTPDGWEQKETTATLALTLRYNATVKTLVDALVTQTDVLQKQIRLKNTSGTKSFQIDFAGTITNNPETKEDNGLLATTIELTKTYNTGLANWFAASIVNGVAVLP